MSLVTAQAAAPQPTKVTNAAVSPAKKFTPKTAKVQSAKRTTSAARRRAPEPERYAALVVDADTGQVLSSDNAEAPRHPASLTKIMTLYLTFEAIEQGKLKMDQQMSVSSWAASQSPTKLGLKPGSTISVHDAILGLITKSANDAAVVLAETLGGSEQKFAEEMTTRAHKLGMLHTTYRNASGLPNDLQITTAHDLAILAMAMMRDFPGYYPLFSTQEFVFEGHVQTNHNRMLTWYEGADGMKTGYTNASGFNLIMSAKRDGRRLIGVVMGGKTAQSRDTQMASLMDAAFARPAGVVPAGSGEVIRPAPRSVMVRASADKPGKDLIGARIASATTAAPGPAANLNKATPQPAAKADSAANDDTQPVQWAMQIGAYSDAAAARKALSTAMFNLPDLRGAVSIAPVTADGRTLYRARISGISESEASVGCRRLENQAILACDVVRVRSTDVDIANN